MPPGCSPSPCWSLLFLPGSSSCCGALYQEDRRGPGLHGQLFCCWMWGLPWALLYPHSQAVEALALHSACWRIQEGPQQAGSPTSVWILPPTAHLQPLSCMPTNHACLRTKNYVICTPSPGPSPPLASPRLPEEGKTHFQLVLTPL